MVEMDKRVDRTGSGPGPEPVRSRAQLRRRFVRTLALFPLLGLVNLAVWGAVLVAVDLTELRHEGDTAFYRARVDKSVARRTSRASAPRLAGRPQLGGAPVLDGHFQYIHLKY